jgi:hypothetical protein
VQGLCCGFALKWKKIGYKNNVSNGNWKQLIRFRERKLLFKKEFFSHICLIIFVIWFHLLSKSFWYGKSVKSTRTKLERYNFIFIWLLMSFFPYILMLGQSCQYLISI